MAAKSSDLKKEIKTETKVVYQLGQHHKLLIIGLAIALIAAVWASFSYSSSLSATQGTLSYTQGQYSNLQSQYSTLSSRYNGSLQTNNNLQTQVSGLQSNLTSANSHINSLSNYVQNQNSTIYQLQNEVNNLQLSASSSSSQAASLQSQLNSAQGTISTQQTQINGLNNNLDMQVSQTLLAASSGNLAFSPSNLQYCKSFTGTYSGILNVTVTIQGSYQVTLWNSLYGNYFTKSQSGGTGQITYAPVTGTSAYSSQVCITYTQGSWINNQATGTASIVLYD